MKPSTTYLILIFLVTGSASAQSTQWREAQDVGGDQRSITGSVICSNAGEESSYLFATAPRLEVKNTASSGYHYSIRIDRDGSNVVITATGPDYEIQSSSPGTRIQILRNDPHHLVANTVENNYQTMNVVTYQLDMTSNQSGVLSRVQTSAPAKGTGMASLSTWSCKRAAPVR